MTKHENPEQNDESKKDEPKKDEPKKDDAPRSETPIARPIRPGGEPPFLATLKRTAITIAVVAFVGSLVLVSLWKSFFHYVGPGEILVITTKNGAELPPGETFAKPGQKGIQEEVLGEG